MKRTFEQEDQDQHSRRAGPSTGLPGITNTLDLNSLRLHHLNPDAPPFRPQPPRPTISGPHLSLALPDLPDGDEWVMVDKILGRPLLGWAEVHYCDSKSLRVDGARYVVGVSAFEVIVGTLDIDGFPGHEDPYIGILDWVYRQFRPAGDIIDLFIPESKKKSTRLFVKIIFENADSASRALALPDLTYKKEKMEVTVTVARCLHRNAGWTLCARSRLSLLENTKRRQLRSEWLDRLLALVPDLSSIVTDESLPKALPTRCRPYTSLDAVDQSTTFHTLRDGNLVGLAPTKDQRNVVPARGQRTVLPEPTQNFDDRLYGRDYYDNDVLTSRERVLATGSAILRDNKKVEHIQSSVDKQIGVQLRASTLQLYKESGAGWAAHATLSELNGFGRLVTGLHVACLDDVDMRSLIDGRGHQVHEKVDSGLRSGLNEQEQEMLWREDHPDETSLPCLRIGYIHEDGRMEPVEPFNANIPFEFNSEELDDPMAAIIRHSPLKEPPMPIPEVDTPLQPDPPSEQFDPILPPLFNGFDLYE